MTTKRLGNSEGEIVFGHLDENGDSAAVLIRSGNTADVTEHYIQLTTKGPLKGGTMNRCPGTYQIICGNSAPQGVGFVLNTENGDLIIRAPNGRIRMEAENIDLIASGHDNQNGNINLIANEKIRIDAKTLDIKTSTYTKILSTGITEVVGKTILKFYGGLVQISEEISKI